jgi:hypothetical protein
MSRVVYLKMDEGKVVASCLNEKVGVSTIERLPAGGVRLVCMSGEGAQHMRRVLRSHMLDGDNVARERARPRTPMW